MMRKLLAAGATAEAAVWLLVAWLLLDVLPGGLYRRLLPTAATPEGTTQVPATPLPPQTRLSLIRVVRAIYRVSHRLPFRSVCFHRAIAAQYMLRRRGLASEMHYGIDPRRTGVMRAHVWITHCGVDVVGGADREGFTEVARFSGTS